MAIAWCMNVSAIAPHKARIKLHKLDNEFERNLARLDKLQLAPEFTEKLALVKALWPRHQQLMHNDEISAQRAEDVFELSEKLLDATDALTCHAANLVGLSEAHYVNMAGRNRMLSQRVGKLFLFREWASLDEKIAALTLPSCLEFESNLQTLEKIENIPPEVAAQLRVVASQWQKFIRTLCPDLTHTSQDPTCPSGCGRRRTSAAQRRHHCHVVRTPDQVAEFILGHNPDAAKQRNT